MKERQIGICVEPAAKVDSTFLKTNIYVIPSPSPSRGHPGIPECKKYQWTYSEFQVLSDFPSVLRVTKYSLKLLICQMMLSQVVL